eukprot:jgi/Chrpa1/26052/Chrysochromulina_OHIO_Genome00027960-RA
MPSGVLALNQLFRAGKPSNLLKEVGLLIHQFDGLELYENFRQARPWEACVSNCLCQGASIPGRFSSMIVYEGLRARADRVAISLPFGDRGGIVINPFSLELDCLYGIDGGTYRLQSPDHPGCPEPGSHWSSNGGFCSAQHVRDQNGAPCSFNGRQHVRDRALEWRPAPAWEQKDMKLFLELYETHGARYTPPAFHSGYNEEGRTQIERMRGWMRRVLAGPPLMLLHICVL